MRLKGKVATTASNSTCIGLFEVLETVASQETLAVVERLFADDIETCTEFVR